MTNDDLLFRLRVHGRPAAGPVASGASVLPFGADIARQCVRGMGALRGRHQRGRGTRPRSEGVGAWRSGSAPALGAGGRWFEVQSPRPSTRYQRIIIDTKGVSGGSCRRASGRQPGRKSPCKRV